MKCFPSQKHALLILFLSFFGLFFSRTQGLYLEQIDSHSLKDTRIAYFPGSFDPFHLGHMAVVKDVLNKNLADYVLVYALPDSDQSKKRVSHPTRLSMLHKLYEKHPRVLISKLMPADMQDLLAPLFDDIKFSIVVGSDIIQTYIKTSQYDDIWMKGLPIRKTKPEHANTSTGAIMAIPADHVIVFNREGDDLSYLKGSYKKRPVTVLTTKTNTDLSSTKARAAVKQKASVARMVSPEIHKIIEENQLYKN